MATLVALADARDEPRLAALSALIAAVAAAMPDTFYAHTSPPLTDAIRTHRRAARGRHLKMVLAEPTRVAAIDTRGVDPVGPEHLDETTVFFREAYPDSWFDGRMLETHRYVGIRERGRLVCVAGVHVHSPRERVAAIGNVATSREHRGRGLATRATAAVCQRLRDEVDVIGLNVAADHATAIHCYQRLGFRTVAEYDESLFTPFGR
jgi:ribosomal protein S18 acetylase RimI-like enzyme